MMPGSDIPHTSTPWKVIVRGTVPLIVHGGNLRMPIATVQPVYMSKSERLANARRIVACVNACADLPTDQLEDVEEFRARIRRGGLI